MSCKSCGSKTLTRDDTTSNLVCQQCGTLQGFDSFETPTFNPSGPVGVSVRVGTSGTGSSLNYKEKKLYEANKLIDEVIFKLNMSGFKPSQLKSMISQITEGEFGQGEWFPVLIGACAYVIMRRDNNPLSMNEVGNVVGCEAHELGRMVNRVVSHLDLSLPGFDLVESFERVVRMFSGFRRIGKDKIGLIREQGVFLVNCAVKWFLSTGRRPLPVVVAVLVFVSEVNGVDGVGIEGVAEEMRVAVTTCWRRYKELLQRLVEVARAGLPWGKDVTVKNVVKNAPFLLKYMEMKSMTGKRREEDSDGHSVVDLGEVVDGCLRRDDVFLYGDERVEEDDSRYFHVVEDGAGIDNLGVDKGDGLQLSPECLSVVYNEFLMQGGGNFTGDVKRVNGKNSKNQLLELDLTDWWNGKSELSKKLLLKQVLEKDVGLDVLPPSFLRGCKAKERRRAKINAAKKRIERILHMNFPALCDSEVVCLSESAPSKKRRRKTLVKDIDWEDFIIETLLLHKVKDEDIETGHYNTLLDLYVFNSGIL